MGSNQQQASPCSPQRENYQALFESIPQSGLKCDILFLVIRNRIQEEPEYVKRLRVVFQFNITKDGRHVTTWTTDTKSNIEGDVYRSEPKAGLKPDCTLTVDDDDWVKMMVGKLNPQRAFLMSRFKVKGNIMLLQKLYSIWFELRRKGKTPELELIQEIMVNEQLLQGLKSEAMAIEIVQRIVKMPQLIANLNAVIRVCVLRDAQVAVQYLISVRPGKSPEFRRSSAKMSDAEAKLWIPDVSFTVDDDDLVLIMYGIYNIDQAIIDNRLTVAGEPETVDRAKALFVQRPIMARL